MKKVFLLLIVCLLQAVSLPAQIVSSGKTTIHINNKPKIEVNTQVYNAFSPSGTNALATMKGKFYALIIGINNYIDPNITGLDKPIRDAEMFYNVITTKYSFNTENVKFLRNATMAEMMGAFDFFAKKVRPEDSFLIFYATGFRRMQRKTASLHGSGTVH
jgi:hypothetical protein